LYPRLQWVNNELYLVDECSHKCGPAVSAAFVNDISAAVHDTEFGAHAIPFGQNGDCSDGRARIVPISVIQFGL